MFPLPDSKKLSHRVKWTLTVLLLLAALPAGAVEQRAVEFERDWTIQTNAEVFSSPAVKDGIVVYGTKEASEGKICAVDSRTGERIWEYSVGSWVESSPAIRGDSVFIGSEKGVLYAFDLHEGTVDWRKDFEENMFSSPFVWRDRLFVGGEAVRALDRQNGEILWKYGADRHWTAALPVVRNGVVYIGTSDPHYILALDAATGRLKWKTPVDYFVEAPPIVESGMVYVGDWHKTFYALEAATGKIVWKKSHATNLHGIFASAVVADDLVFYGNSGGEIQGVNKRTGEVAWRREFPESWMGSPALAREVLFWPNVGKRGHGGPPGRLYALDPETGKTLGRGEIDTNVHSTPVVRDGKIYQGASRGGAGSLSSFFYQIWQADSTELLSGINRTLYSATAGPGRPAIVLSDRKIRALGVESGELLWQQRLGYKPSSSPVIEAGRVIFGTYDGTVHFFDLESGAAHQKRKLASPLKLPPEVAGNKIILAGSRGSLLAVSSDNSQLYWKRKLPGDPVGVEADADRVVVALSSGKLLHYDATTGELIEARYPFSPREKIKITGFKKSGGKFYVQTVGRLFCYKPSANEISWEFGLSSTQVDGSELKLQGDKIYLADWSGRVYCLNRHSGAKLWSAKTSRAITASLILRDGLVWTGTWAGELFALDENSGRKLFQFDLTPGKLFDLSAVPGTVIAAGEDTGLNLVSYEKIQPGYANFERESQRSQAAFPADSLGEVEAAPNGFSPVASGRNLLVGDTGEVIAYRVLRRAEETPYFRANPRRTGVFARSRPGARLDKIWARSFQQELVTEPLFTPELAIVALENELRAFRRATGEPVWSRRLDSPVTVVEGDKDSRRLLVGTAAGEIYEVRLADGRKLRRLQLSDSVENLVLTDAYIFGGTAGGTVTCLNRATGRKNWTYQTGIKGGNVRGVFAHNRLYYPARNGEDNRAILAFEPETGQVIARFPWDSPADYFHLQAARDRLYLFIRPEMYASELIVFDAFTGKQAWKLESADGIPAGPPLLTRNRLIYPAFAYRTPGKLIYRRVEDGEIVYTKKFESTAKSSRKNLTPELTESFLYFYDQTDKLQGFELAD